MDVLGPLLIGFYLLGAFLWNMLAFLWNMLKWIDYGIDEHNLLRCVIHTAWTPIWPIGLAVYATQYLIKYTRTKFNRDLDELFPAPNPEPKKLPTHVEVEELGKTSDAPRYTPQEWMN